MAPYGSDQGMAEWSNNGDPDDYPRVMQSRSHLLGLLRSAASGQLTAAPPTSDMNSRRFIDRIAFEPRQPGSDLQDIELTRISQEVTERFSNLLAVGDGGR